MSPRELSWSGYVRGECQMDSCEVVVRIHSAQSRVARACSNHVWYMLNCRKKPKWWVQHNECIFKRYYSLLSFSTICWILFACACSRSLKDSFLALKKRYLDFESPRSGQVQRCLSTNMWKKTRLSKPSLFCTLVETSSTYKRLKCCCRLIATLLDVAWVYFADWV